MLVWERHFRGAGGRAGFSWGEGKEGVGCLSYPNRKSRDEG